MVVYGRKGFGKTNFECLTTPLLYYGDKRQSMAREKSENLMSEGLLYRKARQIHQTLRDSTLPKRGKKRGNRCTVQPDVAGTIIPGLTGCSREETSKRKASKKSYRREDRIVEVRGKK